MKKIKFLFLVLVMFISCRNSSKDSHTNLSESKFIGAWEQPNPINEKEMQGFVLNQDGSAESINFATLKYKKWWYNADVLYLVVESIGNKVSSTDTIKYKVVSVANNELILKDRQLTLKFSRK